MSENGLRESVKRTSSALDLTISLKFVTEIQNWYKIVTFADITEIDSTTSDIDSDELLLKAGRHSS